MIEGRQWLIALDDLDSEDEEAAEDASINRDGAD